MCTRPVLRTRAEYDPVFLSVERLPVSASSMYQEPVPSVTFAAAYAVFPPASKPSLSGVMVAVVSEIVSTNRTEADARNILVTLVNFGFLIGFISRVLCPEGCRRAKIFTNAAILPRIREFD